jgi:hypothetical protein
MNKHTRKNRPRPPVIRVVKRDTFENESRIPTTLVITNRVFNPCVTLSNSHNTAAAMNVMPITPTIPNEANPSWAQKLAFAVTRSP